MSTSSLKLTINDMETRNYACPSCNYTIPNPFSTRMYLDFKLKFDFCTRCSLVFMNPHPKQEWYDKLYRETFWKTKLEDKYETTLKDKYETQLGRNRKAWSKEAKRSNKLINFMEQSGYIPPKNGRILEVGSAHGLIVSNIANKFKCEALGIEPNDFVRKFSEKYNNVNIIAKKMEDLANWEGLESIDLIIFSHVLENIVDLNTIFAIIRDVLSPKGRVLIETPNIYFPHATHIYHPYSFCKASIRVLLERNGFELDAISTSGEPSTVMSPKYLTVLAHKAARGYETPSGISRLFAFEKMLLGHLWYGIAAKFPLRDIDDIITKRKYRLDQEAQMRILAVETRSLAEKDTKK